MALSNAPAQHLWHLDFSLVLDIHRGRDAHALVQMLLLLLRVVLGGGCPHIRLPMVESDLFWNLTEDRSLLRPRLIRNENPSVIEMFEGTCYFIRFVRSVDTVEQVY